MNKKYITLLLITIFVTGCSNINSTEFNNLSNQNNFNSSLINSSVKLSSNDIKLLDKEYSFHTKALSTEYLAKKINKWLTANDGANLLRELLYAKFKHPSLYNLVVAANPSIYTSINSKVQIIQEKSINQPFKVFIDNSNPFPLTPSAVSASNITSNSFTANWSATTNATGYILTVMKGQTSTDYPLGNVTSYNLTSLTSSTLYSYYIKATNAAGNSSVSNTISITTLNTTNIPVATPPTNVTSTSFTANWNPVPGVTAYVVGVDNNNFIYVGNVTSYNLTGYAKGTYHSYTVTSVFGSEVYGPSNTISFYLPN